MPFATTYGFGVELISAHESGAFPDGTDTLKESKPHQHWDSKAGMTHPVYTTTIVSPAAGYKGPRIPFKVLVKFLPEDKIPTYLGGDIRIEVLVDGIPCGLKVFKEAKLRGKGFKVEFCGFRVGRTEERPFVFNPIPPNLQSKDLGHNFNGIQNIGAAFTAKTVDNTVPTYTEEGVDYSKYPVRPLNLPEHVSHIEVMISVGKKFQTLEKYFMAGATQTTAFYNPPDPRYPLEPKNWRAPMRLVPKLYGAYGTEEEAEYTTPVKVQGARATSVLAKEDNSWLGGSPMSEAMKVFNSNEKISTWKPIGLNNNPKKTQQLKEVEFSSRIHVVRFWMFIVPSLDIAPHSRIIVPKMPRKALKEIMDKLKPIDRLKPMMSGALDENLSPASLLPEWQIPRYWVPKPQADSNAPPTSSAKASLSRRPTKTKATTIRNACAEADSSGSDSDELSDVDDDLGVKAIPTIIRKTISGKSNKPDHPTNRKPVGGGTGVAKLMVPPPVSRHSRVMNDQGVANNHEVERNIKKAKFHSRHKEEDTADECNVERPAKKVKFDFHNKENTDHAM